MSILTLENNITIDFLKSNKFTLDASGQYYFLNIFIEGENPRNRRWFDGFIGSISYFHEENKVMFRGLLSPAHVISKSYVTEYFYDVKLESDLIFLIETIKSKSI